MNTPTVFPSADALGEAAADEILDGLAAATAAGRDYLLGAPSGRTPVSTYRQLGQTAAKRRDVDLRRLVIVMMDDYVERDRTSGRMTRISREAPYSCERFAKEQIVAVIDGGTASIPLTNLLLPEPADPAAYDAEILARGGIDLFLLATGATDGHIAFNPAGSSADSVTRIVELAEQTRKDNMKTFSPHFKVLEDVPRYGVTVGIDTIRRFSKRAVMIAIGADKASAVARLVAEDSYDPSWPATIVWDCADHDLYVDDAAGRARSDA